MTCRGLLLLSVAVLASGSAFAQPWSPDLHSARIARHAAANGVPPSLVRRVIQIESKGNPTLVSKGNYGLMQIRLGTAKAMGYQGDAEGLLDPDVNMTYAVKYLAGAYRAANGNEDGAIRNYQRGYYVSAKAKGFSPYEKPPVLAAAAATPASIERPMPPAPRSPIAALLTPAETPAEIVRARMPKPQAPAADIVDPNRSFDTKPALPPATTAMAPADERAVRPRPVRVEQQFAARPASVRSDATSADAPSSSPPAGIAVPLPRPAPQRPAAPVLAAIEPAAPAPDVQKAAPPQEEPVGPPARRALRHEQKPKVAAVPAAVPSATAPAEPAPRSAASSGESGSLWSAFKSELAAARGTSAEPVRTAAPSAVEAAPATSPATHKKRSAKEEPFDLLSYVKKKIAPDAKPEKKKPHS